MQLVPPPFPFPFPFILPLLYSSPFQRSTQRRPGLLIPSFHPLLQLDHMARATVELDFFGLEKAKSPSQLSHPPKTLDQRRNFRGFQKAISRIDPALLKSVIGSASVPSTPRVELSPSPQLPEASKLQETTIPMTIFYNGTVSVFNLPTDKAESILKLAAEASVKNAESLGAKAAVSGEQQQQQLVGPLSGDLPLFRRMSLHRFLEKRKARLTSLSPYACDIYGSRGFGKKTGMAATYLHPHQM